MNLILVLGVISLSLSSNSWSWTCEDWNSYFQNEIPSYCVGGYQTFHTRSCLPDYEIHDARQCKPNCSALVTRETRARVFIPNFGYTVSQSGVALFIEISHPCVGDLELYLEHENVRVPLKIFSNEMCGNSGVVGWSSDPFSFLRSRFAGVGASGMWDLIIRDCCAQDTGVVHSLELRLCGRPEPLCDPNSGCCYGKENIPAEGGCVDTCPCGSRYLQGKREDGTEICECLDETKIYRQGGGAISCVDCANGTEPDGYMTCRETCPADSVHLSGKRSLGNEMCKCDDPQEAYNRKIASCETCPRNMVTVRSDECVFFDWSCDEWGRFFKPHPPAHCRTGRTYVSCEMNTTQIDVPDSSPCADEVISTISVLDEFAVGGVTVHIDFEHSWIGELQFFLQSPTGTRVPVKQFDNRCPDDLRASSSVWFVDPFRYLETEFTKEPAHGNWSLVIQDCGVVGRGTLNNWSLRFCADTPCDPLPGQEEVLPLGSVCSVSCEDTCPKSSTHVSGTRSNFTEICQCADPREIYVSPRNGSYGKCQRCPDGQDPISYTLCGPICPAGISFPVSGSRALGTDLCECSNRFHIFLSSGTGEFGECVECGGQNQEPVSLVLCNAICPQSANYVEGSRISGTEICDCASSSLFFSRTSNISLGRCEECPYDQESVNSLMCEDSCPSSSVYITGRKISDSEICKCYNVRERYDRSTKECVSCGQNENESGPTFDECIPTCPSSLVHISGSLADGDELCTCSAETPLYHRGKYPFHGFCSTSCFHGFEESSDGSHCVQTCPDKSEYYDGNRTLLNEDCRCWNRSMFYEPSSTGISSFGSCQSCGFALEVDSSFLACEDICPENSVYVSGRKYDGDEICKCDNPGFYYVRNSTFMEFGKCFEWVDGNSSCVKGYEDSPSGGERCIYQTCPPDSLTTENISLGFVYYDRNESGISLLEGEVGEWSFDTSNGYYVVNNIVDGASCLFDFRAYFNPSEDHAKELSVNHNLIRSTYDSVITQKLELKNGDKVKFGWQIEDEMQNYSAVVLDPEEPGYPNLERFFLGIAVQIAGDYAFVGSLEFNGQGAVYVFERSGGGWKKKLKINPPISLTSIIPEKLNFGTKIAVARDSFRIAVTTEWGHIVIYDYREGTSDWVWSSTIEDPCIDPFVAEAYSFFAVWGLAFDASGSTLIASRPDCNPVGSGIESVAFIFTEASGWDDSPTTLDASWYSEDVPNYGVLVDIHGDYCALSSADMVVIYKKESVGNWVRVKVLVDFMGKPDTFFGYLISLTDDFLAVFENARDECSVYIFSKSSSWDEYERLFADTDVNGYFGLGLSVAGNTIAIGAPYEDGLTIAQAGCVYIFEYEGTWEFTHKLYSPNESGSSSFGEILDLSENGLDLIVGNPWYNQYLQGSSFGEAYVYSRNETEKFNFSTPEAQVVVEECYPGSVKYQWISGSLSAGDEICQCPSASRNVYLRDEEYPTRGACVSNCPEGDEVGGFFVCEHTCPPSTYYISGSRINGSEICDCLGEKIYIRGSQSKLGRCSSADCPPEQQICDCGDTNYRFDQKLRTCVPCKQSEEVSPDPASCMSICPSATIHYGGSLRSGDELCDCNDYQRFYYVRGEYPLLGYCKPHAYGNCPTDEYQGVGDGQVTYCMRLCPEDAKWVSGRLKYDNDEVCRCDDPGTYYRTTGTNAHGECVKCPIGQEVSASVSTICRNTCPENTTYVSGTLFFHNEICKPSNSSLFYVNQTLVLWENDELLCPDGTESHATDLQSHCTVASCPNFVSTKWTPSHSVDTITNIQSRTDYRTLLENEFGEWVLQKDGRFKVHTGRKSCEYSLRMNFSTAVDHRVHIQNINPNDNEDYGLFYLDRDENGLWDTPIIDLKGDNYVSFTSIGVKEKHEIFPSVPVEQEKFGRSVEISGDWLIVSTSNGNRAPDVVLYKKTNDVWTETGQRFANDDSFYFLSLSMNGDLMAVGKRPSRSDYPGEVDIYSLVVDTWIWSATLLTPTTPGTSSYFGYSVSLRGDYLLVGAPFYNSPSYSYVYRKGGTPQDWDLISTMSIRASDEPPPGNDYFGTSVFLSRNAEYAAVGAMYYDNNRGAIYIYHRSGSTWSEQAKLTLPNYITQLYPNQGFYHWGRKMSMNEEGDAIVASYKNILCLYQREGVVWNLTHIIEPMNPKGATDDVDFISVAIYGSSLIVAVEKYIHVPEISLWGGFVYFFVRDELSGEWYEGGMFRDSNYLNDAMIAIDNDKDHITQTKTINVVLGDPNDDVYIYNPDRTRITNAGKVVIVSLDANFTRSTTLTSISLIKHQCLPSPASDYVSGSLREKNEVCDCSPWFYLRNASAYPDTGTCVEKCPEGSEPDGLLCVTTCNSSYSSYVKGSRMNLDEICECHETSKVYHQARKDEFGKCEDCLSTDCDVNSTIVIHCPNPHFFFDDVLGVCVPCENFGEESHPNRIECQWTCPPNSNYSSGSLQGQDEICKCLEDGFIYVRGAYSSRRGNCFPVCPAECELNANDNMCEPTCVGDSFFVRGTRVSGEEVCQCVDSLSYYNRSKKECIKYQFGYEADETFMNCQTTCPNTATWVSGSLWSNNEICECSNDAYFYSRSTRDCVVWEDGESECPLGVESNSTGSKKCTISSCPTTTTTTILYNFSISDSISTPNFRSLLETVGSHGMWIWSGTNFIVNIADDDVLCEYDLEVQYNPSTYSIHLLLNGNNIENGSSGYLARKMVLSKNDVVELGGDISSISIDELTLTRTKCTEFMVRYVNGSLKNENEICDCSPRVYIPRKALTSQSGGSSTGNCGDECHDERFEISTSVSSGVEYCVEICPLTISRYVNGSRSQNTEICECYNPQEIYVRATVDALFGSCEKCPDRQVSDQSFMSCTASVGDEFECLVGFELSVSLNCVPTCPPNETVYDDGSRLKGNEVCDCIDPIEIYINFDEANIDRGFGSCIEEKRDLFFPPEDTIADTIAEVVEPIQCTDGWDPLTNCTSPALSLYTRDTFVMGGNSFGSNIGYRRFRFNGRYDGDRRTSSDGDNAEVVSFRSICLSNYWTVLIDSNYRLFIWGVKNEYLPETTTEPTLIDMSSWDSDVPNLKAKKVTCTEGSVFVLTHDGNLYGMGNPMHAEMPFPSLSFRRVWVEKNIYDIQSNFHSVYIILNKLTQVGGNSSGLFVHDVLVCGENNFGSFGVSTNVHFSSVFVRIDFSKVQCLYNTTGNGYVGTPCEGYNRGFILIPTIKAFEHGFVLKYTPTQVYYSGKAHPSLGVDVDVPTRIDFTGVSQADMKKTDKIDFIDRLIDGCLFIVAGEQFFISGPPETCSYGLQSSGTHPSPIVRNSDAYGDFIHNERVYFVTCGFSCFIITEKANVFVFGRNSNGISLVEEGICENNNCDAIKFVGDEYQFVAPSWKRTVVIDHRLVEEYEIFAIAKHEKFLSFEEDETYKYPPSLDFTRSGMKNNVLSIVVNKPEVFGNLDPLLVFFGGDDEESKNVHNMCNYPVIGESEWRVGISSEVDSPREVFDLVLDWRVHRGKCDWVYSNQSSVHDVYSNRLMFVEHFYRGMLNGEPIIRKERFYFDFEVRFPKITLSTVIVMQQEPFEGGYMNSYVVDKTFDRASRTGKILFNVLLTAPNYLIFPDTATSDEYQQRPRLGIPEPNTPEYFVPEDLVLSEIGEEAQPSVLKIYEPICDEKYCYQSFELKFRIISDFRVCAVPMTSIPINVVSQCDYRERDVHHDCVYPWEEMTFFLDIHVDNLCGGEFVEHIDTVYLLKLFSDWTYFFALDTEATVFRMDDWIYARVTLNSSEVYIEKTTVHAVVFVGIEKDMDVTLYQEPNGIVVDRAQFTIDDLGKPNQVGFHFKIVNDLTGLGPGEQQKFAIEVMVRVMYRGNEQPVVPRRTTIDFATAYATNKVEIKVVNERENVFSVLPYVMTLVVVVVLVVLCGFVVAIGLRIGSEKGLFGGLISNSGGGEEGKNQ